jgi:phosphomannomutase
VKAIKFGTDGWRGIIADDFTFDRLLSVAPIAASVLADCASNKHPNPQTIVVGFDRRFMSETFAGHMAEGLATAGFNVLLSNDFAPTPAYSWAAFKQQAIGALVITASHNPGNYLGLKVKGNFGGSVSPQITSQIEAKLGTNLPTPAVPGQIINFDPWDSYCQELRSKVDINKIKTYINSGKLNVFADVMHGAAAGGIAKLLGLPISELNSDRDPLFGGGAPEPLPKYLQSSIKTIRDYGNQHPDTLTLGLVFDGDADRIAAIDRNGDFLSSQVLIPILIEHLSKNRGFSGEIIKTVSTSNLVPLMAKSLDLPLHETPIGYKYIADRMLTTPVLIGGEESGGIGYGNHIPERDALLSALYLLEAIVCADRDLGNLYRSIQARVNYHFYYDRVDVHLASMDVRTKLIDRLNEEFFTTIEGLEVIESNRLDGYKFNLADGSWLLIRFSGTEPVLRLYCEAPTLDRVRHILHGIQTTLLTNSP